MMNTDGDIAPTADDLNAATGRTDVDCDAGGRR